MQRIFRFLLIIAVVIVGVAGYFYWSRTRAMNSGEVRVREQAAASASPQTASANQPPQPQDQPAGAADSQNDQERAQAADVVTLPAAETLSRNPPNRTVLAGTGRFELYRQGDITWRMDTATGQACVLFATEAMWRRTLVYEHGCGAGTRAR
jgi:hypothetical protein